LDNLVGRVVDRAQRLQDVERELGVGAVRPAGQGVGEVLHAEAAAVLLLRADRAEQLDDGLSQTSKLSCGVPSTPDAKVNTAEAWVATSTSTLSPAALAR
jgi:hypothetical protein